MLQNMLLNEGFLPKESIQPGRFLVDVSQPQVAYHDPDVELEAKDLVVKQQISYSQTQEAGSNNNFSASLTKFVALSCSKKMNTSIRVNSSRVTTYQLANSGSWFRRAVQGKKTREWIEEQYNDGWTHLFFVVGYHTMLDANITSTVDEKKDVSGQVEVPVSAALAAGGIVLPVGGITDPKVRAKHEENQGANIHFVAPGERICALQYRKVVFKWFSSRNIDEATLDKDIRWKMLSSLRDFQGGGEEEEGEDNVLEVNLVQDSEARDGKEVFVSELEGEFFF
jgi:hypothetical protein